MQTNLYCTSESCYIAFALWCYFSRLYSTNIRTGKLTHPPSPKGKVQAKLNHMHTHKLHNTHHTHKMCHSHSYTHTPTPTHTYTQKLSTNCLIHTHTQNVCHSHTRTLKNCQLSHSHTHTQTVCHSHTVTHTVCHTHTHTHVYDPYLTVQYMYVQIGITGIALCYLIMLCILWTSSKQKHKL